GERPPARPPRRPPPRGRFAAPALGPPHSLPRLRSDVSRGVEDDVAAPDRTAQCGPIEDVGPDGIDVELLEPGEPITVAIGDANGVAALGENPGHVGPDEPGRTRHASRRHAPVLARTFAELSGNF